jgi:hypothetical protein
LPILDKLLSFLSLPAPLDPAHASYFRKVMVVLIQRKYEPLVKYMAQHNTLDKLLTHIGLYSIMELLIMIVRTAPQPTPRRGSNITMHRGASLTR